MYNTASILTDIQYGESKPAVSVLIQTASTKEVRIVFKAGQEMAQHQAPYPIVVSVVEGAIDFGVSGERVTLEKGMLIALEAHVPHDLKARQDSIVRLSLHKSDDIRRAQQAAEKS
jgi:quercetin dioxygenase-like cupin family protein